MTCARSALWHFQPLVFVFCDMLWRWSPAERTPPKPSLVLQTKFTWSNIADSLCNLRALAFPEGFRRFSEGFQKAWICVFRKGFSEGFQKCAHGFQKVFRRFSEGFQKVFRRSDWQVRKRKILDTFVCFVPLGVIPDGVQKVFRRFSEDVQKVFRRFSEGVHCGIYMVRKPWCLQTVQGFGGAACQQFRPDVQLRFSMKQPWSSSLSSAQITKVLNDACSVTSQPNLECALRSNARMCRRLKAHSDASIWKLRSRVVIPNKRWVVKLVESTRTTRKNTFGHFCPKPPPEFHLQSKLSIPAFGFQILCNFIGKLIEVIWLINWLGAKHVHFVKPISSASPLWWKRIWIGFGFGLIHNNFDLLTLITV